MNKCAMAQFRQTKLYGAQICQNEMNTDISHFQCKINEVQCLMVIIGEMNEHSGFDDAGLQGNKRNEGNTSGRLQQKINKIQHFGRAGNKGNIRHIRKYSRKVERGKLIKYPGSLVPP